MVERFRKVGGALFCQDCDDVVEESDGSGLLRPAWGTPLSVGAENYLKICMS